MAAGPAGSGDGAANRAEPILDPTLPIVDAHHHLWLQSDATLRALDADDEELGPLARNFSVHPRYLIEEMMADATAGHDVRASVYVGAHAMHRRSGPAHLRSVGEVEFASGMAAMAESGLFGEPRLCAAIVGPVDLRRGAAARETMEAHMAAGGGRYRGVRPAAVGYDARVPRLSQAIGSAPGVMAGATFREGFAELAGLGLSCDVFLFEPQLPELVDLARAFPDTQIILNHVGMPVGLGGLKGTLEARFPIWRAAIGEVARCGNVAVKLGGLGNAMCGFPVAGRPERTGSAELAAVWGPYITACIEAFGPERAMFESNFPVDAVTAPYPVIWNTFKRIAVGASATEKAALFSGTAARIYRIETEAADG